MKGSMNMREMSEVKKLLEQKNIVSEEKNSADGLNSRLKEEKTLQKKKNQSKVIGTVQNEAWGETSRGKERASVTCGTLSGGLIYVHLESTMGGRDAVVAEKVFEEIVVRNFPNTDENFNPKDLIN